MNLQAFWNLFFIFFNIYLYICDMVKKEWDLNKILFLATVIGWAVTAGIGISEFREMRKTLEKMQEQMMEQQQLNGKIIMYIEMDSKNE